MSSNFQLSALYPCLKPCNSKVTTKCASSDGPCLCNDQVLIHDTLCCGKSECDSFTLQSIDTYITSYCNVFGINVVSLDNQDCGGAASGTSTSSATTFSTSSVRPLSTSTFGSVGTSNSSPTSSGSSSGSSSSGSGGQNSGSGSSSINGGLIGGAVGGIVGAMLLGGLIVFFLMRRRRTPNQQQQQQQQPHNGTAPHYGPGAQPAAATSISYNPGNQNRPYRHPSQPNMSELSPTPAAVQPANNHIPNSLQKPISAPIASVSPVSPHSNRATPPANAPFPPPYHTQAELGNTAPGPRELGNNFVSPNELGNGVARPTGPAEMGAAYGGQHYTAELPPGGSIYHR